MAALKCSSRDTFCVDCADCALCCEFKNASFYILSLSFLIDVCVIWIFWLFLHSDEESGAYGIERYKIWRICDKCGIRLLLRILLTTRKRILLGYDLGTNVFALVAQYVQSVSATSPTSQLSSTFFLYIYTSIYP